MNYIYYHSADLDGKASGAIAYGFLNKLYPDNVTLVPINYGQPVDLNQFTWDDFVYMLDFSIQPNELMIELNKRTHLIWIDHHISAIKALEKEEFKGIQDVMFAGCELTWQWFYPTMAIPEAIALLGRYDIWCNNDPRWETEIKPLQYGVRTLPHNPSDEIWDNLIFDSLFLKNIIDRGVIISTYQKQVDAGYIKSYGFDVEFEGLKGIALNRGGASSSIFDSVWDEAKYDVMIPFTVIPAGGWTVSLYTTKDIDLSVIAKKYGGGGHKQASGFQCSELPFKLPERSI